MSDTIIKPRSLMVTLFSGPRLSEKMLAGPTSGFDYLRLFLSIAVIAFHTIVVCYGAETERSVYGGVFRPAITIILPAFFALSGFLVAGSLLRAHSVVVFLSLRAIRIFPALCLEVVISALLIGPMLTVNDIGSYFSSPLLHEYFLNIVGDIHYQLPGVFLSNPLPEKVNVQLWTIPFELECYITLSALSLFGIAKRPLAFLGVVAFAMVAIPSAAYLTHYHPDQYGHPAGRLLVLCFLAGVSFYLYRDKMVHSAALCVVSLALSLVFLVRAETAYFAVFPVTYLTVYVGLLSPKRLPVIFSGDYSYGLYLYGFPVQQVVAMLLPQYRYWWVNLVLSLLISAALAFLSWTFVEAKILGRKRRIVEAIQYVVGLPVQYSGRIFPRPGLRP